MTEMKKAVRNITISHVSSSVQDREKYHLSSEQRDGLMHNLRMKFHDIEGLMVISTCNRTEVYIESTQTSAYDLLNHFIRTVNPMGNAEVEREFFHVNNRTIDTVYHLLNVANGLRSAVVGDGQILSQIKEAYQLSMQIGTHGSMLERAFQSVFRSHKRISNESSFRNGSTSTAYRALKTIEEVFGKNGLKSKKLLVVGAGEIAQDVLKYLSKFEFHQAAISNRTFDHAEQLAYHYGLNTEAWIAIEKNELQGYDAIITAVSNRKNLINRLPNDGKLRVVVDLALPANVSPALQFTENAKVFNLDAITEQIDATDDERKGALAIVENIIKEEMQIFVDWLKKSDVRVFLQSYKEQLKSLVGSSIEQTLGDKLSAIEQELLIETIARKLVKAPAVVMNQTKAGELSENNMEFLRKAFAAERQLA